MKRYTGYMPKKSGRRELLPPGGYVAKVMKAEDRDFSNGPALMLSFDIAEGEHQGFFAEDYRSNTYDNKTWRGVTYLTQPKGDGTEKDGWAVNAMNNLVAVLQESNPGYAWDWGPIEQGDYSQLKGKLLGVLFGNVEWEYQGKTGWNTKCRALIPAEDVRAGQFEVPADKPLKGSSPSQSPGAGKAEEWTEDAFSGDNDLPF